ncbi:ankyrin repeat domain-containing protein [Amycolatopsis speibonae]|uniref:Ankyrin repeat domain-containing protein n=1 Tax=Amycolatopsis speibonae TaxID=1450224 RepID=A0ABV7P1H7_9PSEU
MIGERAIVALLAALVLGACSPQAPGAPPPSAPSAPTPPVESRPHRQGVPVNQLFEADVNLVKQAVDAGADLETRDDHGRTPLLVAVTEDRVEIAEILVKAGADPNALDGRHDTPWLVTGVTGSVPMAKLLLEAKPDLTITNRFGGVSLIPASERGHVEYVRLVASSGIDVDHVNDLGWTALLEAVILGDGGPRHQEVVRALTAAGADVGLADKKGVSPLAHARSKGQTTVARILGEAGAS